MSDTAVRVPRTERSKANVGVLVDPIGSYGRGVTRGIISYHRYRQWQLSMLRTWIFQPASFLSDWSGDGLIAMVADEATLVEVQRTGKPFVCVSSLLPELLPNSVVADDRAVGRLAAQHFLEKGYRNYAFAAQSDSSTLPAFIRDRYEGFAQELEAAGLSAQSALDPRELPEMLHGVALPVAVFAANDEIGIRVIKTAEQLGLRVPEDVAVVGVDNDDLLVESRSVGLSSIELPTGKIGFEACRALDSMLSGTARAPEVVALPPVRLVQRNSSDITAISDPEVATALAFLRQHCSQPISIADVVARVPLSRRALERKFRRHLQRSLFDEIQRLRLERAASLLLETDLSVEQVARASGFSSRSRFHSTFAQARGCTPNAYREMVRQNR